MISQHQFYFQVYLQDVDVGFKYVTPELVTDATKYVGTRCAFALHFVRSAAQHLFSPCALAQLCALPCSWDKIKSGSKHTDTVAVFSFIFYFFLT